MFWVFVALCVLATAGLLAVAVRAYADRRSGLSAAEKHDYDAFQKCVYTLESLALDEARVNNNPFADIVLDEVRKARTSVRSNHNRKAVS